MHTIAELKYSKKEDAETLCDRAMVQIHEKKYDRPYTGKNPAAGRRLLGNGNPMPNGGDKQSRPILYMIIQKCRVGRRISAPASHRTVRESLPSHGYSYSTVMRYRWGYI
ncbi:MAG: PD-(D/E)XK nuclease domain-containing protein [Tannerella sp.]|nr:PD-(D/E)XK nuclease domain-containing protein [Tannerella sp.]